MQFDIGVQGCVTAHAGKQERSGVDSLKRVTKTMTHFIAE
jgi:hypothetical protein